MKDRFFNFSGRMGRLAFWLNIVGLKIVLVILLAVILIILKNDDQSPMWIFSSVCIQIVYLACLSSLVIRRIHDIDKPTYWVYPAILSFIILDIFKEKTLFDRITQVEGVGTYIGFTMIIILLVTIFMIYIPLFFRKGTIGENQYGSDPLERKTT